jgi:hypothetical protein
MGKVERGVKAPKSKIKDNDGYDERHHESGPPVPATQLNKGDLVLQHG